MDENAIPQLNKYHALSIWSDMDLTLIPVASGTNINQLNLQWGYGKDKWLHLLGILKCNSWYMLQCHQQFNEIASVVGAWKSNYTQHKPMDIIASQCPRMNWFLLEKERPVFNWTGSF